MNLLNQLGEQLERRNSHTDEGRALMRRLAILNGRDGFTLTHALQIAAERFDEDAKAFDATKADAVQRIAEDAPPLFNPVAAERLGNQFRQQAADVRALLEALEGDDEEESVAA
jgi:hypothetical protein